MHKSKALIKRAMININRAVHDIETVTINFESQGITNHSLFRLEDELAKIISQLNHMYLHKKQW